MEDLHKTAIDNAKSEDTIAEKVTAIMGSMTFIVGFAMFIVLWVAVNVAFPEWHIDGYPFILLNLILGLIAAFTCPFLLMSQAKQDEKDRKLVEYNVAINKQAELDTELALTKLDAIREELLKIHEIKNDIQSMRLELTVTLAEVQKATKRHHA